MNFYINQKIIESLVDEGHVILQVFVNDDECLYFSVLDFTESFSSTAGAVEFNSVRGVNITDFIKNHGGNPNTVIVKSKFNEYILNADVIRCEFSKYVKWFKWGSASR